MKWWIYWFEALKLNTVLWDNLWHKWKITGKERHRSNRKLHVLAVNLLDLELGLHRPQLCFVTKSWNGCPLQTDYIHFFTPSSEIRSPVSFRTTEKSSVKYLKTGSVKLWHKCSERVQKWGGMYWNIFIPPCLFQTAKISKGWSVLSPDINNSKTVEIFLTPRAWIVGYSSYRMQSYTCVHENSHVATVERGFCYFLKHSTVSPYFGLILV